MPPLIPEPVRSWPPRRQTEWIVDHYAAGRCGRNQALRMLDEISEERLALALSIHLCSRSDR